MKRLILFCVLLSSFLVFKITTYGLADTSSSKVHYSIDFSDYKDGPIEDWLRYKGFGFEKKAKNRKVIKLDVSEDGLVIETTKRARGFFPNRSLILKKSSKVRIEWGVIQYPKNASYEKRVNNEAIMLYIFFGHKRISCNNLMIPKSPYFIALYLGKDDKLEKPYTGKNCKEQGRFVCVGNPKPNETVVTELNLDEAFKEYFKNGLVPNISGVMLGVDTTSSKNGGQAAAYIKKIEFLD